MPEDELTYWWARRQIQPMREEARENRAANGLFFLYKFLPGLFNKEANKLTLSDFLPAWMTDK